MLRQYSPQRFCYEEINRCGIAYPVGTIPIGEIFLLASPDSGSRPRKCIVRAWRTRRYAHRTRQGVWTDIFLLRFGHLAIVEDLATGRQFDVADHISRLGGQPCADGVPVGPLRLSGRRYADRRL